jgi:hypothetical protein
MFEDRWLRMLSYFKYTSNVILFIILCVPSGGTKGWLGGPRPPPKKMKNYYNTLGNFIKLKLYIDIYSFAHRVVGSTLNDPCFLFFILLSFKKIMFNIQPMHSKSNHLLNPLNQ